jgi:hypothetical protein
LPVKNTLPRSSRGLIDQVRHRRQSTAEFRGRVVPEEVTGIKERSETPGAPVKPPGPGAVAGRAFVFQAWIAPDVPVVTEDVADAVGRFSGFGLSGRSSPLLALVGSRVLE